MNSKTARELRVESIGTIRGYYPHDYTFSCFKLSEGNERIRCSVLQEPLHNQGTLFPTVWF